MKLQRRDCPIKMRLIPYGAGWTDVYADFGDGELYFIISCVEGDQFYNLLDILYHFHPDAEDTDGAFERMEYKSETYGGSGTLLYARKGEFEWDEEGSSSHWILEREPGNGAEFFVNVTIDVYRKESKHYEYRVEYKDLCYAVAAAYTKAMKQCGFFGYHMSTYTDDINLRYLLALKSTALDNYEARELTIHKEYGDWESSDFEKEIELLLFDM